MEEYVAEMPRRKEQKKMERDKIKVVDTVKVTASKKLEETDEYKKAWKEECEAIDAIVRGKN